jgi:acyl-coenzyme A thioesterase PaaI-like protein
MTTSLENARRVQRGESPPPPIGRLLGFVLKAIEPGHAVFEMEADERHHNPMGTLHGGIYCDLIGALSTRHHYSINGCSGTRAAQSGQASGLQSSLGR